MSNVRRLPVVHKSEQARLDALAAEQAAMRDIRRGAGHLIATNRLDLLALIHAELMADLDLYVARETIKPRGRP